MVKVVYPGSFDPPTSGHFSILEQAVAIFDHVVIGIGVNPDKPPLFSFEERMSFWQLYIDRLNMNASTLSAYSTSSLPSDHISVVSYTGLTVDFARQQGANAILRGLRDSQDLRSEHYLARINKSIDGMPTLFLLPEDDCILVSSTFVRQVAEFSENLTAKLDGIVLPSVIAALRRKFGKSHEC